MFRLLNALVLIATLVITSVAVSTAHGQQRVQREELVICSGTGLITITIAPDGEPLKSAEVCPDAISIFHAAFVPLGLPRQTLCIVGRVYLTAVVRQSGRKPVSPSARGPPPES